MAVELGHLWMRPVNEALGLSVDLREMDQIYINARKRFGATLVPADGSGVRAVFQALA